MSVVSRFLVAVVWWTGILLVLLSAVTLLSGQGLGDVIRQLPVWGGLSFVLSAFPAAIAVSEQVLPRQGGVAVGELGAVTFGVAALTVLTFVLVAYVGPALAGGGDAAGGSTSIEPRSMALGDLRAAAVQSVREIESEVGKHGLSLGWRQANILGWHYHRRLAAIAQPPLFALIGLLLGFWGRRLPAPALGQGLYWAVGLFLVVSTYLAGENSFELVALQSAGPAFFSGFFVLMIPPVLAAGLAIPTAVLLWSGEAGVAG